MNQSDCSKIKRGMQKPSLLRLKRITEILHLDLYELPGNDCAAVDKEDSRRFPDGILQLYRTIYHGKQ